MMQGGTAGKFLAMLYEMMDFLIPNYIREGKNQLVVAIGCTGGKHRSVYHRKRPFTTIWQGKKGYGLKIEHRDIDKDNRVRGVDGMSFSSGVKDELSRQIPPAPATANRGDGGDFKPVRSGKKISGQDLFSIEIHTENVAVARKIL